LPAKQRRRRAKKSNAAGEQKKATPQASKKKAMPQASKKKRCRRRALSLYCQAAV